MSNSVREIPQGPPPVVTLGELDALLALPRIVRYRARPAHPDVRWCRPCGFWTFPNRRGECMFCDAVIDRRLHAV